MGSHAEAGYQKSPRTHALHHLREMPRDCIPLRKVTAADWAGKKQRTRTNLGQQGPWGSPDQGSAHAKEHFKVRPRRSGPLCRGQQYLLLETALRLRGIEVPLTYTRVHASKHNRSVLFIQCD